MTSDQESGRLFLLLKAAQTAMRSALNDVLEDIGITAPQLLILRALDQMPAMSSAELSRQCVVSPQAMVVAITRLEKDGLLERVKGEGRIIETHLTDEGKRKLELAHDRITAAENYLRDRIGSDRIDELCETLENVNTAFLKSHVVRTSRSWEITD
jgi:DNA-binding MarR family transcriptional regulator